MSTISSSTPATSSNALGIAGLEQVYDQLAAAIDQAGPGKAELFLVKLALLNAQALGDAEVFGRHLQAALQDL
ncbi:DUF2783 domain-containing protein [Acidovorax carolinensis]|uniref:DUF2783 domain-containing protein n=1 Tax=Acidovorax carolinensis TaxID=553814 RepID=UPI0019512A3C|nr:DUF2783 domain-containing protein [Acidovorax carolinensis]